MQLGSSMGAPMTTRLLIAYSLIAFIALVGAGLLLRSRLGRRKRRRATNHIQMRIRE